MSVRKIFLSVICLLCFLSAHAGQGADSVRIYYRAGYRYVEPGFRDNRAALERLVRDIGEARSAGRLERISIRSYASPDGANRANELLSERRADSLSSWIVRHGSIPASLIDRQAAGIAWDELRAQVAASGMPYRDEVLNVLDNTPVWIFNEKNQIVGGRKQRLMDLRGGEPYRYMLREFFPDLRSSVVLTLYVRESEQDNAVEKGKEAEETERLHKPEAMNEPQPEPVRELEPVTKNEPQPAQGDTPFPSDVTAAGQPVGPTSWSPSILVKTNAVGWAMAVSNIAVEMDLSKRLSFHIPVYYSAWNYFSRTTKFRMLAAQPELRYWPTQDRRFFTGVHFGVASYNLALGGKWRIQDHDGTTPALGGGVSAGYRLPLEKTGRWGVEFSLGCGVYSLHYDKFHNESGGAYSSTVRKTFFGLDNAAVSFSYTFDLKKKGGRR